MRVLHQGQERALCKHVWWHDCYTARWLPASAGSRMVGCPNAHALAIIFSGAVPLDDEAREMLDAAKVVHELASLAP